MRQTHNFWIEREEYSCEWRLPSTLGPGEVALNLLIAHSTAAKQSNKEPGRINLMDQGEAECRTARKNLERVEGIEPSTKAWEAFVLPLNYTRISRVTLYQKSKPK